MALESPGVGGLRGCWREPSRRLPWLLAGGFTGRGFPSSPAGDERRRGSGWEGAGACPPTPPAGSGGIQEGGRKLQAGGSLLQLEGGGPARRAPRGSGHAAAQPASPLSVPLDVLAP